MPRQVQESRCGPLPEQAERQVRHVRMKIRRRPGKASRHQRPEPPQKNAADQNRLIAGQKLRVHLGLLCCTAGKTSPQVQASAMTAVVALMRVKTTGAPRANRDKRALTGLPLARV
jgi:hypothetical protein